MEFYWSAAEVSGTKKNTSGCLAKPQHGREEKRKPLCFRERVEEPIPEGLNRIGSRMYACGAEGAKPFNGFRLLPLRLERVPALFSRSDAFSIIE